MAEHNATHLATSAVFESEAQAQGRYNERIENRSTWNCPSGRPLHFPRAVFCRGKAELGKDLQREATLKKNQ